MSSEKNLEFDELVDRKNTDSLKFDFAAERGKPTDVLPLWVADMDFKTSSGIIEALMKRAGHGVFGYTESKDDYFESVSSWLKAHHDLDVQKEWMLKTPGVVFGLACAVRAYTNEGDHILIQQPLYYPVMEVISDNNRKITNSELVLKDGHYEIDFEDFERKIIEDNVKLFILCNPHNPVGRVWTKDELAKIADIALRHEVVIVSDEIHEDFVMPGHKHIPLINVDERIKNACVICTSPSKTFNLAGLQAANIFIPNEELRKKFKKQIDVTGYSQLGTFAIESTKAAYEKGEEWHSAVVKYIADNYLFAKEYIEKHIPKIKVIEPEGTYLLWLDLRGYGLAANEIRSRIIDKAKLWLDDGIIFGRSGAGFQRINLATQRQTLEEALSRLGKAFD